MYKLPLKNMNISKLSVFHKQDELLVAIMFILVVYAKDKSFTLNKEVLVKCLTLIACLTSNQYKVRH